MTGAEVFEYVEMNPFRGGEPVFRGTKIRVSHLLGGLADGMNFEQILNEHKQLTQRHLQAAFAIAEAAFREADLWRLIAAARII
jgi:uncharacterized protein (DUF433 family)